VQTTHTGLGLTRMIAGTHGFIFLYAGVSTPPSVNEGAGRLIIRSCAGTAIPPWRASCRASDSIVDLDAMRRVGTNELKTSAIRHQFQQYLCHLPKRWPQYGPVRWTRIWRRWDTAYLVIRKHSLRVGADFVRNAALDGFAVNRGVPGARSPTERRTTVHRLPAGVRPTSAPTSMPRASNGCVHTGNRLLLPG